MQEVQTAKTQKENVRTAKAKPDTKKTQEPEPEAPEEQKPLGYKEVELPNGDIDMVPYYTQEEADAQNKTKK